jgi:hypothetical protein
MSLNYFSNDDSRKEWMKINCNSLNAGTLKADDRGEDIVFLQARNTFSTFNGQLENFQFEDAVNNIATGKLLDQAFQDTNQEFRPISWSEGDGTKLNVVRIDDNKAWGIEYKGEEGKKAIVDFEFHAAIENRRDGDGVIGGITQFDGINYAVIEAEPYILKPNNDEEQVRLVYDLISDGRCSYTIRERLEMQKDDKISVKFQLKKNVNGKGLRIRQMFMTCKILKEVDA